MMSGEMGRSIWAHPLSYLKLMSKYRGSLAEGKRPGTVKMGVALHWNKARRWRLQRMVVAGLAVRATGMTSRARG